jgi:hypothetical protein
MPLSPMRNCPVPGCPALVRSGRCDAHGGPVTTGYRWGRTGAQPDRLRGRASQERRRRLFAERPLCQTCLDEIVRSLAAQPAKVRHRRSA